MRYSIKSRDRIYVKGYDFFSFVKNIGKNATKFAKSMSNKYSQKLTDSAKKSTTDAIKTALKRANQKTAEATGDLVGNKIADKITNVSTEMQPKSPKELHSVELRSKEIHSTKEAITEIPKERYISPQKRQQLMN